MNKKWQTSIDVKRRMQRLRSLAFIFVGSLGGINSTTSSSTTSRRQQQQRRWNHYPTNPVWDNLLNVASPERDRQVATPLFWHIHKAGGTTLHDFLSSCLNLTLAAEVGVLDGHQDDQVRRVVMYCA
jgi:hypothetical protein